MSRENVIKGRTLRLEAPQRLKLVEHEGLFELLDCFLSRVLVRTAGLESSYPPHRGPQPIICLHPCTGSFSHSAFSIAFKALFSGVYTLCLSSSVLLSLNNNKKKKIFI